MQPTWHFFEGLVGSCWAGLAEFSGECWQANLVWMGDSMHVPAAAQLVPVCNVSTPSILPGYSRRAAARLRRIDVHMQDADKRVRRYFWVRRH
jgi:hypothetical protein